MDPRRVVILDLSDDDLDALMHDPGADVEDRLDGARWPG